MRFTRINLASSFIVSFIACACLLFGAGAHLHLRAQGTPQPTAAAALNNAPADTARGVELYKAANYPEAIKVLRGAVKGRKDDAQARLHLGIALSRAGENKEARKAFEKAIKLRPEMPEPYIGMAFIFFVAGKMREAEAAATRALTLDPRNAESHYAIGLLRLRQESPLKALEEINEALRLNPGFGTALTLKAHVLLEAFAAEHGSVASESSPAQDQPPASPSPERRAMLANWLQEAAESLDTYVKLFPTSPDAARLRGQAETLRLHAEAVGKSNEPLVYKASEVTKKAQIVSKPEPLYTDKARNKGVTGTVRLRMLLSFDGQVRNIHVVHGLPQGLTEMSVNAARRIKFTPATKDGRPVSQYVQVEYNFNIY